MLPNQFIDEIYQAGGRIYSVGGSVRETIRKKHKQVLAHIDEPYDYDYVVALLPLTIIAEIANKYGTTTQCGECFGIIKFTFEYKDKKLTVDLALPRREASTGDKHTEFEVVLDPNIPIEEDLKRRDFTINAIAQDIKTGQIIDPYGGETDIECMVVKLVSPTAFQEDPLRMLRACQFAARLGYSIDPPTFGAMRKHHRLIATVSPERINLELSKLLVLAEHPSIGLEFVRLSGMLRIIIPELAATDNILQRGDNHKFDVYHHLLVATDYAHGNLILCWAALLHDIGKPVVREEREDRDYFIGHEQVSAALAYKILKRLKYPNDFIKQVVHLVQQHMFSYTYTPASTRRFIKRIGINNIDQLFTLRKADRYGQGRVPVSTGLAWFYKKIQEEIHRKPPLQIKDLSISGTDLITAYDLKPGPLIGKILTHLFEKTMDTPNFNNKEQLLLMAKEYLDARSNTASMEDPSKLTTSTKDTVR